MVMMVVSAVIPGIVPGVVPSVPASVIPGVIPSVPAPVVPGIVPSVPAGTVPARVIPGVVPVAVAEIPGVIDAGIVVGFLNCDEVDVDRFFAAECVNDLAVAGLLDNGYFGKEIAREGLFTEFSGSFILDLGGLAGFSCVAGVQVVLEHRRFFRRRRRK